ncbi:MAG: hypothetical protein IJA21_01500, partial [Clostridia bacterium]|nr:hypothetical protein [Clostridia bacterium]
MHLRLHRRCSLISKASKYPTYGSSRGCGGTKYPLKLRCGRTAQSRWLSSFDHYSRRPKPGGQLQKQEL